MVFHRGFFLEGLFFISVIATDAVPEPSTYAISTGLFAFLFDATYRRK